MLHEAPAAGDGGGVERATLAGWPARLELEIHARPTGSLLTHCRHLGPLRVQRPFYPEGQDVCHVCLLHPPGGLVPGDELDIDIRIGSGARALVTTPAAAKVYRSDGRRASQTQRLSVARGAALEWLPQETIVFEGARFDMDTRVVLEPGAIFVGWDVQCLGRPAIGERFTVGSCRSRLEVHTGTVPLYVDRAIWDGGSDVLSRSYGLAGHPAVGTMLVVGARATWLQVVRDLIAASPSRSHLSATLLGQGELLICRYLGPSAIRSRELFADIWVALRPDLLGRTAVPPRIWST